MEAKRKNISVHPALAKVMLQMEEADRSVVQVGPTNSFLLFLAIGKVLRDRVSIMICFDFCTGKCLSLVIISHTMPNKLS